MGIKPWTLLQKSYIDKEGDAQLSNYEKNQIDLVLCLWQSFLQDNYLVSPVFVVHPFHTRKTIDKPVSVQNWYQ